MDESECTSCVVEEPFAFSSFVIVSGGAVSSGTAFSPSIMTSSGTTVSLACSFWVEQSLASTVENEGNLGASSKLLFAGWVVSAFLIGRARCDRELNRGPKVVTAFGVDLTALEATEAARNLGMRYIL